MIYVGKAINLRNCVRSYFQKIIRRGGEYYDYVVDGFGEEPRRVKQ